MLLHAAREASIARTRKTFRVFMSPPLDRRIVDRREGENNAPPASGTAADQKQDQQDRDRHAEQPEQNPADLAGLGPEGRNALFHGFSPCNDEPYEAKAVPVTFRLRQGGCPGGFRA